MVEDVSEADSQQMAASNALAEPEASQKSQQQEVLQEAPEQQKEVPRFVPGKLAVCMHCGYLSEDFNKCLRCRRKLPEDVKSVPSLLSGNDVKRDNDLKCHLSERKSPAKTNGKYKFIDDAQALLCLIFEQKLLFASSKFFD